MNKPAGKCEHCGKFFKNITLHILQYKKKNLDCYNYYLDKYKFEFKFPWKRLKDNDCLICECCKKECYQLYRHLIQYSKDCYNYYISKYGSESNCPIGVFAKLYCPDCKKLLPDHRAEYCSNCRLTKYNVMKDSNICKRNIEKGRQTHFKRFGVVYPSQTEKAREILRKKTTARVSLYERGTPVVGLNEEKCLDYLQEHIGIEIKRQYVIIGYWLDGYIECLNLALEFDEEGHDRVKDSIRQKRITDKLNCKFIRISDSDWKASKDLVLFKVKQIIQ